MSATTIDRPAEAETMRLGPDIRRRARRVSSMGMFSRDEVVMLTLFAEGLCVSTIARRLNMSDRTVRRRTRMLCDRLEVGSIIQVVAWAARRGLI